MSERITAAQNDWRLDYGVGTSCQVRLLACASQEAGGQLVWLDPAGWAGWADVAAGLPSPLNLTLLSSSSVTPFVSRRMPRSTVQKSRLWARAR